MDLIDRALVFATTAHAEVGQRRKYTGEPYIVHPIEVMMLVRSVGGTDEMQAAALLHDVIEDTGVTHYQIKTEFTVEIADMVLTLTDFETGNRANRKALACLRLHQASAEVQTIKLADLISNTSSIVQHGPKFAATYLREKQEMLTVLTKGDPYLYAIAREQIDQAFKDLLECVA